ncbi:MAG: sulfite reductase subunit alpha, partial [Planctomycetales bacterium]|nr:sulfite reductase subunit alpha [Planctomycetales bacterium]
AIVNGVILGLTSESRAAAVVNGNGADAGLLEDASASAAVEPAEEFPWHDPALTIVERLEMARDKPLERKLMAAMAQLDCGACGYLCQTYSEAIAAGAENCLTLCSPGGGETAKALKTILKESGGASGTGGATTPAKPAAVGTRQNPVIATIKSVRNLNGDESAKHTAHVEIDLSGAGVSYRVGDALGVYPTNCDELVEAVIAALGATGDELVASPAGASLALREALRRDCDLAAVEEELVELLATAVEDAEQRTALRQIIENDACGEHDVLDILHLVSSAQPAVQEIVDRLGRLQPRLYSIASSPKARPGEVHLTVGRVERNLRDRPRKGVASTMFADRLQPGDDVRVFVHASRDFTVPSSPDVPMIMVGPGTGIAPFRAFLEERIASSSAGKDWLFFGDQCSATDFLYREELEALGDAEQLRLDTAFSRDQAEKIYVQHRMQQAGAELYDWLQQGAYFFVCGDAKRMAVDVDRALHELIAEHGKLSPEQAGEYVARMRQEGRYVRDVY